ncbi:hypothetical protein JD974_21530 [Chromobacterium haemolyticum]|uniref:Metallo-beta-lactamase domain-containing protein n=1 Tax=Chromobacterium haemolyticum TaxID=394935 RepID=A0ABS3GTZ2_9NEIS|nr:MBL fold metallo-hydrolase [Chromobacterium haemolyticum]MBK0416990.1 hypothetical protein [Chromobacterium haemolyticum]MBO0418117.1 hypothetical protein [Chromobacterium haemolyticum]MBO0501387.1 hypothetical protein [Chromobacterium haemolyticum]
MTSTKNLKNKTETLIAQVESFFERKEYQRSGKCIRFTAIKEDCISQLSQSDGVTTLTIDLSYWEFWNHILQTRRIGERHQFEINERQHHTWYKLEVIWDDHIKHGYTYPTFGNEPPQYFRLLSCTPIDAITLKSSPQLKNKTWPITQSNNQKNDSWEFLSFYVGQGMCSLIKNKQHGILIDAGAGTPIIRKDYQKKSFKDELAEELKNIDCISLILSHLDQDHWRLIAWNKNILNKIQTIHIPSNSQKLIKKDKNIISKINEEKKDFIIQLSSTEKLEIFRSIPLHKSNNTDCLVSLFTNRNNEIALQSGDYVYEDMSKDKNNKISNLNKKTYNAIVVPHHGDQASAINIPSPATPNKALAFFSAGNHKGYKHPNQKSIDEHKKSGYNIKHPNTTQSIIKYKLI